MELQKMLRDTARLKLFLWPLVVYPTLPTVAAILDRFL